jgi:hypothetical protein
MGFLQLAYHFWAYFFLSSSCQTSNKSDKIGLAQEYCLPDHNPKLEKLVGILHSLYIYTTYMTPCDAAG